MTDEKRLMANAVRLWCIEKGYEEITDGGRCDMSFKMCGRRLGFIFEFDKTAEELKALAEAVKNEYSFIYTVINDSKKAERGYKAYSARIRNLLLQRQLRSRLCVSDFPRTELDILSCI